MADADLLRRIRDEVYQAKRLVRATRNHTKLTASALQDSEERLDALIDEMEQRIPRPEEAQGNGSNKRHDTANA